MKKDILKRIIIVLIIIVFILFVMFFFFLRNQFLPKRGSNQSDVKIVYELDDFITVKNIWLSMRVQVHCMAQAPRDLKSLWRNFILNAESTIRVPLIMH